MTKVNSKEHIVHKNGNQIEEENSPLPSLLDETEMENKDARNELGIVDNEKKEEGKSKKTMLVHRISKKCREHKYIRIYWDSILVRLIFIGIPSYHIYLLSCIYSNPIFFILYSYIIVVVMDGIYVLIKRAGHDHYWFSLTFVAYTIVMIFIIVYEMDYKYRENDVACETNATQLKYIKSCGESMNIKSICSLVEVIVVGFLATLVVGRWIMPPSRQMDNESIFIQVYSYTTLSADVIEIAQYMQNKDVAKNYYLLKACQAIFGISLIQFSFSPAVVKKRNMKLTGVRRLIDIFFSTEAWSFALSIFTQELPCFILRLILISSICCDMDYALSFFALKNGLMIILLTRQIIVLCWHQCQAEKKTLPLKE